MHWMKSRITAASAKVTKDMLRASGKWRTLGGMFAELEAVLAVKSAHLHCSLDEGNTANKSLMPLSQMAETPAFLIVGPVLKSFCHRSAHVKHNRRL